MIRLNPQQVQNKSVTRNFFPPRQSYFSEVYTKKEFKTFLETNATTPKGMLDDTKHYGVDNIWNSYMLGQGSGDSARNYFMLLKIVKNFSNNDNLWVSFVEGLHWHAAILMCLMCSIFDYEDNNLVHTSLKNKHFKMAGVPHYKESDLSPIQILNSIIKEEFNAPMLTNHIQVQILHPKNHRFDIDPSMKILKQMSM
jgi:hypothetical protein